MNLNRVFILGNMAANPEQRALPSGQAVVNFSVATNRMWTDRDGKRQTEAEFHRIVAYGRLAEIVTQYLAKGGLVFIEGRLKNSSWQAADGSKRYRTEIVAQGLQLGPRLAGSSGEGRAPYSEDRRSPSDSPPTPRQTDQSVSREVTDDAAARRYDKSDQDLSGEPRPTGAGDATARNGGARTPSDNERVRGATDDERREEDIPTVNLDEDEPSSTEESENPQKINPEDLPF
jgi:single-strand DNA-binding protein